MGAKQKVREPVILVTGGAKRAGAAIVRRLHAHGANIVLHYHRSADEARALAAELDAVRSGSVLTVRADLLRVGSLAAMVARAAGRYGRLDALVNNASSFYPTPAGRMTAAQFDDLVGINLRAPLFLSEAALPLLSRARGCIVNIADIHAERPMRGHAIYSVAKAGVVGLTRSLALEYGPRVRVNAVAPGPVLWPEGRQWSAPALRRDIVARTALRRTGSPEDIAGAVQFLVFDAPYVTGQVLAVDGGRSVVL